MDEEQTVIPNLVRYVLFLFSRNFKGKFFKFLSIHWKTVTNHYLYVFLNFLLSFYQPIRYSNRETVRDILTCRQRVIFVTSLGLGILEEWFFNFPKPTTTFETNCLTNEDHRAGIFKESMGARNRGGRGLSYRTARLHRLAEFIPWNRSPGSINV